MTSAPTIGGGVYNTANGIASTICGGQQNTVNGNWSTAAGGTENVADGSYATIGGGWSNVASSSSSTVAGGFENNASDDSCTVGGGKRNSASRDGSTVCGGFGNNASGKRSFVGGGASNSASSSHSSVAGGIENEADGWYATIGGGAVNNASGQLSTIGGGAGSLASGEGSTVAGGIGILSGHLASGYASTISGGADNSALGCGSTVPGGLYIIAGGAFSFAAGRTARVRSAEHTEDYDGDEGTFVWADASNLPYHDPFTSTGPNQFLIRAAGGVGIGTNSPNNQLTVNGTMDVTGLLGVGRAVPIYPLHVGTNTSNGNGAHCTNAGQWVSTSDKNTKTAFTEVNARHVLNQVVDLPVTQWRYKGEDESVRHIGPMAQDFHAAFGLGESDKHIGMIDANGVTLAAIQGLHQLIEEKDQEIADLKSRLERLETRMTRIASHD